MRLAPIFNLPETAMSRPANLFVKSLTEASWTRQRMQNVDMLLDVVRIFIVPDNPNTPTNQRVMFQTRLLSTVLEIILSQDAPPFVKSAVDNF